MIDQSFGAYEKHHTNAEYQCLERQNNGKMNSVEDACYAVRYLMEVRRDV